MNPPSGLRIDGQPAVRGDPVLLLAQTDTVNGVVTLGQPVAPWWADDGLVVVTEGDSLNASTFLLQAAHLDPWGVALRIGSGRPTEQAAILVSEPLPTEGAEDTAAVSLVGPGNQPPRLCTRYVSTGPGLDATLYAGSSSSVSLRRRWTRTGG